MRLWSIHPKYLDAKGLVALWRETLLAQKVLKGETKGYTNHPQLIRFKNQEDPLNSIGWYLHFVFEEAKERGYNFSSDKFHHSNEIINIPVNSGQLIYEFNHLKNKLIKRAPQKFEEIKEIEFPLSHPLFSMVEGEVESWEILNT